MFMAAQQCTVIYVGKDVNCCNSQIAAVKNLYLYGGKIQWQKMGLYF